MIKWHRIVGNACLGILVFLAASSVSAQSIFMDDFESGTPPDNIPADGMPWYINTSGRPASFQSANNPFPIGDIYAYLHDDVSDGTNGTRLVSSNTGDSGMKEQFIAGQVTTYSFDFWEPLDTGAPDSNNLGFGYTNADDLNTGERNYRGYLGGGQIRPDAQVPGAGGPVDYPLQSVHTVFMIANDSALPVNNYHDGRTLGSLQADVWISLSGADPVYAFSVQKQSGGNPQGVGFRTFSGDVEEMFIDNVLLVPGATFDRGEFAVGPRLTLRIDPTSGQVEIHNPAEEAVVFNSYRITSAGNSLDASGWTGVAGKPGFPAGDGTGNGWEPGPNVDAGEIVEWYLLGDSSLAAGASVALGTAYDEAIDAQDVAFQFQLDDLTVVTGPVEFGAVQPGGPVGDYNGNGIVDAADYTVWRDNFGSATPLLNDPSGPPVGQAQYTQWKANFGSVAGSGAALVSAVPEPSAALVALTLLGAVAAARRNNR